MMRRTARFTTLGLALCVACSSEDDGGSPADGGIATDSSHLLPDGSDAGGAPGSGGTAASGGSGAQGGIGGGGVAGSSAGSAGASGAGGIAGTSSLGGASGSGGLSGAAGGGAAAGAAGIAGSAGDGSDAAADGGEDAPIDAPPDVVSQICTPGKYQCVGNALEQCTTSGSAWTLVQQCGAGLCNAAGGVCGQCVPGSKSCSGNVPLVCSASYTWQSQTACAGSTPECVTGVCKPATGSSCTNLAATCGASSNDSCCATEKVPGGTFKRSYDGVTYTTDTWTATVSEFWLDTYEVTVGRFRRFVDNGQSTQANPPSTGAGAHPKIASSGWNSAWTSSLATSPVALRAALACDANYATWTDAPGANETRPINCVTWYDAFAFCAWDGGRLATEAEWNSAAAAGSEQRVYPWSVPPSSTVVTNGHASYWVNGTDTCMGDGVPGCTLADLLPVGKKPIGNNAFGHTDLSGNVWEWTLDVYANPYSLVPCSDCALLSGASYRTLRGGSFFANPASILSSKRNFSPPTLRGYSTGIRCAKSF